MPTNQTDKPQKYVRMGVRGRWTYQQLQGATRAVTEQDYQLVQHHRGLGLKDHTVYTITALVRYS